MDLVVNVRACERGVGQKAPRFHNPRENLECDQCSGTKELDNARELKTFGQFGQADEKEWMWFVGLKDISNALRDDTGQCKFPRSVLAD
ncbi:hypothetical protein BPOR_0001g00640 [Botrytis porri]|uniref:Uncharacterized protein n=1 Tax=Botrytis porri TaxID=87229 RepID=A0A4Z1L6Y2_9HELO|nr:hypothetical protein BPOR_0001g00640 [Botrytis porri]